MILVASTSMVVVHKMHPTWLVLTEFTADDSIAHRFFANLLPEGGVRERQTFFEPTHYIEWKKVTVRLIVP